MLKYLAEGSNEKRKYVVDDKIVEKQILGDGIMEKRIKAVLEGINGDIVSYGGNAMLEEGIIDSFDVIDIMSRLEEEFDLEIDAECAVADNFANMDAIIAMMKRIVK